MLHPNAHRCAQRGTSGSGWALSRFNHLMTDRDINRFANHLNRRQVRMELYAGKWRCNSYIRTLDCNCRRPGVGYCTARLNGPKPLPIFANPAGRNRRDGESRWGEYQGPSALHRRCLG